MDPTHDDRVGYTGLAAGTRPRDSLLGLAEGTRNTDSKHGLETRTRNMDSKHGLETRTRNTDSKHGLDTMNKLNHSHDCPELARINAQEKRDRLEQRAAIEVHVEYDDTPVQGNASASGDDEFDREVEAKILERLDSGGVWAWALVKVTATLNVDGADPIEGEACLGACCYESEDEFRQCPHFDDLKAEALDDLADKMNALRSALATDL